MKFNGNLGPEKNQTHHERKNGKNHHVMAKPPNQVKTSKSTQQSNRMRIKTEGIAQTRWVKEQLEKEIKKCQQ